jgi:hypothetical protein
MLWMLMLTVYQQYARDDTTGVVRPPQRLAARKTPALVSAVGARDRLTPAARGLETRSVQKRAGTCTSRIWRMVVVVVVTTATTATHQQQLLRVYVGVGMLPGRHDCALYPYPYWYWYWYW